MLRFNKRLNIVIAEDNVVSAANKARRMVFYFKRPFAALTSGIFLPLYKTFIRPHLKNSIQANHPILCRDAEALEKGAEAGPEVRESASACSV